MRVLFCIVTLFLLIIAGCSNGNPVTPITGNSPGSILDHTSITNQISSTGIMGPFELSIDRNNGTAELITQRHVSIGESYIVSGESFFVTYPCSQCLFINGFGIDGDLVEVQFGIKHPFEKGNPADPPTGKNRLDLDIFDTTLLVMPLGSTSTHYNLTNKDIYDGVLHEPHGFTTELSNLTGDTSAMPYVLVVDDSDPANPQNTFNKFEMGAIDSFDVVFNITPGDTLSFDLYLTFGYGASATFLERLDPQYFNPEFNRKAPWKITATPQGNWSSTDDTTPTNLDILVYDWQIGANVDAALTNPSDVFAASEISQVSVEIPGMNNTLQSVTGNQYIQGTGAPQDPLIYQIPVVNENLLLAGMYTGLVKVTDERAPQSITEGRDFLIDSPDGKTLNQYEIPEYATFQTFTAEVTSAQAFNPVDVTPPGLYFYPVDVCVNGNYVYTAGELHGINIFDINDPENPVWIHNVALNGSSNAVYAIGNYAYVVHTGYLTILDISDPPSASIVGSVNISGEPADVYVSGNYAYVANDWQGLYIVNVTDPASPSITNSIDTDGYAYGVYVAGNYCYIADYDYGLQIIDITDPSTASIIKTFATASEAFEVSVQGDHAYVIEDSLLEVVNINPPASAHQVNSIGLVSPFSIYIEGAYAYITDLFNGLQIFDISTPGSETYEKTVDTPYGPVSSWKSGEYLYVVDDRSALHVIDVDPVSSATIINSIITPMFVAAVDIAEDYAFVGDSVKGLFVMDINPPEDASIVAFLDTGDGGVLDLEISDDYAFVASYYNGLQVIDISNPLSPSVSTSLSGAGRAYSLAIDGDYAYIAAYSDGFTVVDISTPTSPSLAGSLAVTGNTFDVDVYGNYACVTSQSTGIHIIDISTPSAPVLAQTVTYGDPRAVTMNSEYAFVGDLLSEFYIIDYDPPASASIINTIPMLGQSFKSDYDNGYIFQSNMIDTLTIIDVDPPLSAYKDATLAMPGTGLDVKVHNGYAYVAANHGGLRIVDLYG